MSSEFDSTTAPSGTASQFPPACRTCGEPIIADTCPVCFANNAPHLRLDALLDWRADNILARRIAAMPAARGGFDRTATQTPDPVDVEVPMPGLLPDPEEQPQADACDCFGCLFYGRCTRAMAPLANFSVQDLGMAAKPGPTIPAWEIEMSRRLDAIRQQMDNALVAGHEAGRIERAADIVRDGSLDAARDKYKCTTAACNCPDSIHRGATCKHKIAEIMDHNLRRRLGDPALYVYPA